MSTVLNAPDPRAARRLVTGALLTLAVLVVGLFIVKWSPYYAKTFSAAAHHSIGNSIVTGKETAPPGASWAAAWTYARAYFLAIWQALVLALLLGACVQVLIPTRWVARHLGELGLRSTALAGLLTASAMMCTCCTAPVIVGLRRQRASAGTAMGMFVGTPTLNPAVLLFIGFVLSWPFAALRLVVGLVLVAAVAWLANRLSDDRAVAQADVPLSPIEDPRSGPLDVLAAWLRVLWWEIATIVPGYVLIVLLLGAARVWLFSPGALAGSNAAVATVIAALAGTLFVIPTGSEVPIVQTFARAGLGAGPAAALLVALPAISLPSIFIARSAFSPRVLAVTLATVAFAGLVAAAIAVAFHLTP